MVAIKEFAEKKVGVFGLGKAGNAAVASLVDSGAEVYAWDDGEMGREKLAALQSKAHITPIEEWPWEACEALVLAPGVPLTHPKPHAVVDLAHKHNVPIIGDVELLYRAAPEATYIGITGTNGKSTTTALIGHLCEVAGLEVFVGGNIGTPACDLPVLGQKGIYVIELSSYQLDLMDRAKFHISVFLNVTPDHLDRHGDMAGYIAAKAHIFDRQTQEDIAIIATDDSYTSDIYENLKEKQNQNVIEVSSSKKLSDAVWAEGDEIKVNMAGAQSGFSLAGHLHLKGQHNAQNVAVATATLLSLSVPLEVIKKGVERFVGLPHRAQYVGVFDGITCVNDSKATNAEAAEKALTSYENIYWIVGGRAKEGGINMLKPHFNRVKHAFLIGEAAEDFAHTLQGVEHTNSGTIAKAVADAHAAIKAAGDKDAVLLLSPACASFDQYPNFELRGDDFCTQVQKLATPGEA
jgi:UDP-N-acetylmuramoylalanine--D-glutamate ligase